MRRVSSVILGIFAIVFLTALPNAQAPSPTAPAPPGVTFARDIQPILEKNCASCHSGDLKLAELDLSNREAAMQGGEHGPVIVAGNAEKSKLYRMVAGLDQPVMPMEGDALKPAEVAAIKAWIDQGANWESAVSFAKDIQPIMERSCWNCHGEAMQLSKLDLRTREGALRGGAHGPAATPGNAEQSRLYRAVAHIDAIKMPMQGDKLKPEEIAAFKAWIDQGVPWDASRDADDRETCDERDRRAREHGADAGAAQLLGVQAAGAEDAAARVESRVRHIRSIGSSRRHALRRSSSRRRAPTSARSSAARTST